MRIVYLTESTEFGPTEVQLTAAMSRSVAHGHRIALLCPRAKGLQRWLGLLQKRGLGRVVRCLPKSRLGLLAMGRAAHAVFRNADLIHHHLQKPLAGQLPLSISSRIGVPFLVSFASVPEGLDTLEPERHEYGRLLRAASRILVGSRAANRRLVGQFGLHPDFVDVLRPGILDEIFPQSAPRRSLRRRLGLAPDALLIAVPGRITDSSGHALLIPLLQALAERHPRARVLVLGDGPARPDLQQQVCDAGVEALAIFLGARNDIPELLTASDVGLVTSASDPSMGLIEILAAGLPVVAPWSEEACEAVEDGINGYLTMPGQTAAAIWALERVLDLPSTEREELGAAGRAMARERFDLHRNLDRLMRIYRDLRPHEAAGSTAGGVPDSLPESWIDEERPRPEPSENELPG